MLDPGRLRVFQIDVASHEVRPELVLTAERGEWALPRFLSDVRAGNDDVTRRRYLAQLLHRSASDATECGLSQTDALSMVGRGLFWRFLVDRSLLAGLEPRAVCEGATTWEQCLDGKTRALRTFRWLDEVFNGGLLPFEQKPRDFAAVVYSRVLGNIAHGATETGQLRLPTDWQQVNFSYVPVGLLSEVYEAFAHHLDAGEATRNSIHYTPAHIAEFIVAQALAPLPQSARPRILDPAAGAGVFLIAAFRGLVEREWQATGERPRRRRIREILNRQLVGFDVDGRALRLAELALYLTALELDPKPRPLDELRFDELRGTVLFDVSSTRQGSLGAVEARFRGAFDLVMGNPPWTAKAKALPDKKIWVEHSRGVVKQRLGQERAREFSFPDTNMDLPFVWRAMEWAKEGGQIALVTHARWLFGISERATRARNDLLEATRVTGILNGAALRLTRVWPEVDAPWCVLFATNERPEPFAQAAFQFLSPALDAEIDSKQARVRVDWLDAQVVRVADVIEKPWTLKMRFRGNRLAARAFESMRRLGEPLGSYLGRLGTSFKNGYQVGGTARKQNDARHMRGMPDTRGAGPLGFVIDVRTLPPFDRETLLCRRDPSIYRAPLLLVSESISADRLTPRVSRADRDLVFHESYHGVSLAGIAEADLLAKYLQLWLQSSTMVFVELLTDGRYGAERDALYQESLDLLPVVPIAALNVGLRARVVDLSRRMANGLSDALADEVDAFVFDTYDLSSIERESVRDTLCTATPATEAKRRAVRAPYPDERRAFVETLADSLGSVLSASGLRAAVREQEALRCAPWRVLEVRMARDVHGPSTEPPMQAFLEEADANGASLVVVRADEMTWFVGLLERYGLWTRTRARLLATDLLAERSFA